MATSKPRPLSVCPSQYATFNLGDSHQKVYSSPSLDPPTKTTQLATLHRSATEYSCSQPKKNRLSRLSLSIPVVSPTNSSGFTRPVPNAIITPPSSTQASSTPTDSNSFLIAIAGQERYVFELKEELNKAEKELKRLKKQLASHETNKKESQLKNMEPLQPVQSLDFDDGAIMKSLDMIGQGLEAKQREVARQSLSAPKTLRRKFSGTHTRNLSLLPDQYNFNKLSSNGPLPDKIIDQSNRSKALSSSSDSQTSIRESSQDTKILFSPKNMANGAKQLVELAEDVKEGFKSSMWTFFEDLRQATVGDEGINGTCTSKSLANDNRNSRITCLFDDENKKRNTLPKFTPSRTWETLVGCPSPAQACLETKSPSEIKYSLTKKCPISPKSFSISNNDELEDSWLDWDSPVSKSVRWSDSTITSGSVSLPDTEGFHRDNK